jgi:O-antigen/teichoic acid export membrane protein
MSTAPRSQVARNIAANLGGQLALLVLGIVAVKLVFTRLGPDAFGMVLFVQTINVVLAGVLDLGVPSITIREVAAHAVDDPGYVRALIRTASTLYWAAFALAAGVLLLTAPWMATHWVHLTSMDAGRATVVVRILGVAALTVVPRVLYTSVCRGLQRMVSNNAIDVGAGLLQQVGIVVILARGGDLFAVVLWMALVYVAAVIAYVVAVARFLSPVAVVPGWSTGAIVHNARFSAHMMVISALGVIHAYIDKLTVSKLLPIASLGWYAFASSLVARGALLTNAIADAVYPALSGMFERGESAAMAAQYRVAQDLVCYVTVPVYAAIAYLSLPLFTMLFGPSTAHALLLPVVILCLGYFANGTLSILYVFSLAVGKPQLTSRYSLFAALFTVPVTVVAVARFGLAGASFGFLSYHLIFYAVAIPTYCRECLAMPAGQWYRHLARVVGLAGATYGVGFAVAGWFWKLQAIALLAAFMVASAGFALVAYRWIDPELRARLRPGSSMRLLRAA